MFGQPNTSDIPLITTYAQAVAREAKITPIRGRSPECKPLGDRKRSQYNIRREGDRIMVRVYNTDVITYHPNGDIMVDTGGWSSNTTHQIIGAVLGWHLRTHTFDSRTWITAYDTEDNRGTFRLPNDTPTHLTTDNNGNYYTIHNPTSVMVHKINRKAANQMRARYKPFTQFFESYIALCKDTITNKYTGNVTEVVSFSRDVDDGDARTLDALMLSEDAADHYIATMRLCAMASHMWGPNPHVELPKLRAKFKRELIRTNRLEVLVTEALPLGKQGKDNYSSWF